MKNIAVDHVGIRITAERASRALQLVRGGTLNEQELINVHTNALRHGEQQLVEAIEGVMRQQFPRAATRVFGSKGSTAREKVKVNLAAVQPYVDLEKTK